MSPSRLGRVPAVAVLAVLVAAVVGVLALSVRVGVSALWSLSFGSPRIYGLLLVLLCALPGLLLTLPRLTRRKRAPSRAGLHATSPAVAPPPPLTRRATREASVSHVVTDAAAIVAYLLAQVPVPLPWASAGKAATVASVTGSAQAVEVTGRMAWVSVLVIGLGLVGGLVAHLFPTRPRLRLLALSLVTLVPLVAWLVVTR